MKTKIAILSLILITLFIYLYLFTGTKIFNPKSLESYDEQSNILQLPIVKYKKGFFTHTFYGQVTIENKKYDLRFKMDYLNKTLVFEDYKKLNQYIKILGKDYARPVAEQYVYLDINAESYFDNIIEDGINVRLIETIENKQDRQIIINLSAQTLKMRL